MYFDIATMVRRGNVQAPSDRNSVRASLVPERLDAIGRCADMPPRRMVLEHLDQARRHVAEAERHVVRQHARASRALGGWTRFDPLPLFDIGLMKGPKAREGGLRLKA